MKPRKNPGDMMIIQNKMMMIQTELHTHYTLLTGLHQVHKKKSTKSRRNGHDAGDARQMMFTDMKKACVD